MDLSIPADLVPSIRSFVATGRYPDESTVMRQAMALLQRQENIAAIQAGIDDIEAGRCRPLAEVDKEIRAKFGFKAP